MCASRTLDAVQAVLSRHPIVSVNQFEMMTVKRMKCRFQSVLLITLLDDFFV